MLPGTAECPWLSLSRRKGWAQTWLICLQTAFGRACDHPKISSYLKYHQEESRVLQAPDGDSTNCASPRCHSPMSPPGPSPACPQHKFWAVVAYLNLLHYSNYSNYLNCSSWVQAIEASKKLVFILRAADTEVCAVFPVLLPQQPPANLGGCTSTRPVPFGWIPPFGCIPLLSLPTGSTQAASEDGSE